MTLTQANVNKRREQEIDNRSFDEEFEAPIIECLGYDAGPPAALRRIAVDTDGKLVLTT